jgi:hypothetical protein
MISGFYGEKVSKEQFLGILDEIINSEKEIFELNCHPAFLDSILIDYSSYSKQRVNELKILTSKEIKEQIVKRNILLTNYEILKK